MTIQIEGFSFCAALVLDEVGFVIETAPYLKFMMNWEKPHVLRYCLGRNWKCQEICK